MDLGGLGLGGGGITPEQQAQAQQLQAMQLQLQVPHTLMCCDVMKLSIGVGAQTIKEPVGYLRQLQLPKLR